MAPRKAFMQSRLPSRCLISGYLDAKNIIAYKTFTVLFSLKDLIFNSNRSSMKIMKKGYFTHIEKETLENDNFRKVLYTAKNCQLVLMNLQPGEDIGMEVHDEGDQFFRFEKGEGKVIIDETEYIVGDGDSVIIPQGARHNVLNTSEKEELKLYTIYAPPHHKDGVVRATREEAEKDAPEFDGTTSE